MYIKFICSKSAYIHLHNDVSLVEVLRLSRVGIIEALATITTSVSAGLVLK